MDKDAVEDVLLETVAQAPYPHPEPVATWSLKATCNKNWLISKGYRHLSRTLATQSGMTNQRLNEFGLVSVRDIWMKVQGYAKTEPAPS